MHTHTTSTASRRRSHLLGTTARLLFFIAAGGSCGPVATSEQASAPSTSTRGTNPFDGARFYVNPDYAAEVASAGGAGAKVATFPTAVWLDSIAAVHLLGRYLDDASGQKPPAAADAGPAAPMLVLAVVYDLPGRDCSAASSSGELQPNAGGEARYKKEFIDAIAASFKAHGSLRIAAVIEPDSLANLATNLANPACRAADPIYRRSIAYAVKTLSALPNVSLYLDAAHAGWLGWPGNDEKIAAIYQDVLAKAGGADKIRGFATDVSNYDPVVAAQAEGDTGTGAGNPCRDELSYTKKLTEQLARVGIQGKTFVIDTSRDGQTTHAGVWCNAKGAGIGERPRASPFPGIDAYYWIKPPGESDGTSDPAAPRFDKSCGTPDSLTGAPQAGKFFPAAFAELVANAHPPL